jgi:predicted transcriptional regulator
MKLKKTKGSYIEPMRADKEVVMAAVSNNKFALKFASEELQNDLDILALKGESF